MDPSIRFSFIEANGVTLHCAEAGPANGHLSFFCTAFPEFWFAWREFFQPLAAHACRRNPRNVFQKSRLLLAKVR